VSRADLVHVALDEVREVHAVRGGVVDEEPGAAFGFDARGLGFRFLVEAGFEVLFLVAPFGGCSRTTGHWFARCARPGTSAARI
jgi:hypothetical protein